MWRMFCHESTRYGSGEKYFAHFGCRRYVELHYLDDPIVEVELKETANGDYWGWIETGEDKPGMIWNYEVSFRACFPYGPEEEIKKGRGRIVRLSVDKVS